MEVCQSGYYTEDFRTQEVPAGFDFALYGELKTVFIYITHICLREITICTGTL